MAICEYLEETQGGSKLYPEDALSRARQRAWLEYDTATLADAWQFLNAKDRATADARRVAFRDRLERLEEVLEHGPYFAGPKFGMVDAVFAPLLRYFNLIDPAVTQKMFHRLPRAGRWREALALRERVIAASRGQGFRIRPCRARLQTVPAYRRPRAGFVGGGRGTELSRQPPRPRADADECGIVCLMVSEMGTPYRSSLIRALTHQLQVAGKVARLINTDRSDKSVDLTLRQAIRYRADASIILSGMPDKSITDLCLKNGQRMVRINRDDEQEGPLRINLDDAAAAERIVTAFLRAACRRLAFANSQAGTPSLMPREHGLIAATARGLTVAVERFGPTSYAGGAVLAQRLLTRSERPDAVVCATDLLACGFMDAARQWFAISIPDDLCVAGFDDIEQASWSSYGLTTFTQPIDRIAQEAVSWLTSDDKDAKPQSSLCRLDADLVWRNWIRGG